MTNELPRPEYPQPQFVRKNWMNLNGIWDFEMDQSKSGEQRGLQNVPALSGKILVPFCPESKLSGIEHRDFLWSVWYKRKVTVPEEWLENGRRTFLHIGACDYETRIFVNGDFVGAHFGGYTPICLEITKWLHSGANDITVCAKDQTDDPKTPSGKQSVQYASFGCSYTRTTGIWQTVWLENTPSAYIRSVKMTPSLQNGTLAVQARLENAAGLSLKAEAFFDGKCVARASAAVAWREASLLLKLEELHPWDLEHPDLYDITFTLGEDVVTSYFGLRDIDLRDGKTYLNGRPVFQRLILDQGYYPDGIYTAPDDGELIADIERAKAMGFNGARLHQKVFDPRFLYHCDRMGYLVWDEHANWGLDTTSSAAFEGFLPEWLEILQRDYNHPSIIGWCPLNETPRNINERFVRCLYELTLEFDPTRIFIDNSGWAHVEGAYDLYDVHDYCGNPEAFRAKYAPLLENKPVECLSWWGGSYQHCGTTERNDIRFVSEFGGARWVIAEEDNGGDNWGYGEQVQDEQAFIDRYRGLVDALLDNPKIGAFCYTQLTDVEQEQNGLYTYRRKPKFDPEVIRKITSRKAAMEEED